MGAPFALVLWWAISEPALVGPSGGQLRFPTGPRSGVGATGRRRDGRPERARHRCRVHNPVLNANFSEYQKHDYFLKSDVIY